MRADDMDCRPIERDEINLYRKKKYLHFVFVRTNIFQSTPTKRPAFYLHVLRIRNMWTTIQN